jgi:hypothetical protein
MKTIKIEGYEVILDDEDYEKIKDLKWYNAKTGNKKINRESYGPYFLYCSIITRRPHRHKMIYLHRFIMNAQPGQIVDHKSRNTLDNRKSNLRITSATNNSRNTAIINKDGNIKGMRIVKDGKYLAYDVRVSVKNRQKYIGTFKNPMIAEYELIKALHAYHGTESRYAKYKSKYTEEYNPTARIVKVRVEEIEG